MEGFLWELLRGEYILEISKSEKRVACGGHVCEWIRTK
jgi:hypothetical protein